MLFFSHAMGNQQSEKSISVNRVAGSTCTAKLVMILKGKEGTDKSFGQVLEGNFGLTKCLLLFGTKTTKQVMQDTAH